MIPSLLLSGYHNYVPVNCIMSLISSHPNVCCVSISLSLSLSISLSLSLSLYAADWWVETVPVIVNSIYVFSIGCLVAAGSQHFPPVISICRYCILGWSDFNFSRFSKNRQIAVDWLWVQFQTIDKFCRAPPWRTCGKVFVFKKSQIPSKEYFFENS